MRVYCQLTYATSSAVDTRGNYGTGISTRRTCRPLQRICRAQALVRCHLAGLYATISAGEAFGTASWCGPNTIVVADSARHMPRARCTNDPARNGIATTMRMKTHYGRAGIPFANHLIRCRLHNASMLLARTLTLL